MSYVAEDDEIEDGELIDTAELEDSPGHNHDVGAMEMVDDAAVPDVAGVDRHQLPPPLPLLSSSASSTPPPLSTSSGLGHGTSTPPADAFAAHRQLSPISTSFYPSRPNSYMGSAPGLASRDISLNSPDSLSDAGAVGTFSYFSNIRNPATSTTPSATTSRHSTPLDSEDSDIGASQALKTLQVGSRKSSYSPLRGRSPTSMLASANVSGGARHTQSSSSPSSQASALASRPPSTTSCKRSNDTTINQSSSPAIQVGQLSDTATLIMQQLNEKRDLRAEQDRYKRMKLESDIYTRDLKARTARDEREHAMRLAQQEHAHEREIGDQRMEQMKLEIELSRARREEEEVRIRRIMLEKDLNPT